MYYGEKLNSISHLVGAVLALVDTRPMDHHQLHSIWPYNGPALHHVDPLPQLSPTKIKTHL